MTETLIEALHPRAKDVNLFVPSHCGNGHELIGDNYRVRRTTRGRWRWECATCRHRWQHDSTLRAKERALNPRPLRPLSTLEQVAARYKLDPDATEWLRVTYAALTLRDRLLIGSLSLDELAA